MKIFLALVRGRQEGRQTGKGSGAGSQEGMYRIRGRKACKGSG